MPNFTAEERTMIMLYDAGSLAGTITMLEDMQNELTKSERRLRRLTASVLEKLSQMSEEEFEKLRDEGGFE